MVKIGALIGALFTSVGTFFQILMFVFVIDGTWNYTDLENFVVLPGRMIPILLFYFGMILVMLSGFIKGKLFLKIGGAVMILGFICKIVAWIVSGLYGVVFNAGAILMFIGSLLYFIGCNHYRKHNKVAEFTGLLLFIFVLWSEIVLGIVIVIIVSRGASSMIQIHFVNLIIQSVIFTLHAWVFGFSKKRVSYKDDVEDTLSVEDGGAFSSYMPDDMKKKEKKRKKPQEDDEISFIF